MGASVINMTLTVMYITVRPRDQKAIISRRILQSEDT